MSRPLLIDGGGVGTQENNKNCARIQEMILLGNSNYKMPKNGVESEWFNADQRAALYSFGGLIHDRHLA